MPQKQWWTFDRPVTGDGVFWTAIAVGIASAAWAVATTDEPTPFLIAYAIIGGFAAGWFSTGVIAGSIRAVIRGYTDNDPPA